MLLYPIPALLTPFPRTFIIKGNADEGKNSPSCPFPALMTSFPDIEFLNEETTSCISGKVIGSMKQ